MRPMPCSAIPRRGASTISTTALPEEVRFASPDDRYSRQRLAACWDQDRVAKAHILVAGAGALGNEVLKNLALIGVGKLTVIDFDRIETANLARSVLFGEDDIGAGKGSTAAKALFKLNPEVRVTAIDGDLEQDLGLGWIRDCDIVLGCLDSIHARWALNRACWKAGRPWINAGINATVGEVCLHAPSQGACYECGMTQHMWQQVHERRSCMLLPKRLPPKTIPGTAVIASLTAALQVKEALAWIHGEKHLLPGEMLLVSLEPYLMSTFMTSPRPDCLAHETYLPSMFIEASPGEMTVSELLREVPGSVSLRIDFDLLVSWECATCGDELVGRRLSTNSGEQAACPKCKTLRTPHLVHEISRDHWLARRSLASIGVPARDILGIITKSGIGYAELTKNS
jgi:molybdopterin/thiamine biosynthesis adenylyltransferase